MSRGRGVNGTLLTFLIVCITAGASPIATGAPLPPWLRILASATAPAQPFIHAGVAAPRLAQLQAEGLPAVDVLRRSDLLVRADGRVEQHMYFARQLLDAGGVRDYGTMALGAQIATDQLVLEEAFVIPASGPRRAFDSATLQVVNVQSGDIFSDSRTVVLPFAGLRVGDTAVVVARIVRDTRKWPLPWSEIFSTGSRLAVERLDVSVSWESGVEAPVWKTDDPALKCGLVGARRFRCIRDGIPALPDDPDTRGWRDVMPHLVVAHARTWEDLARLNRAMVEGSIGNDPALAQFAAKITAGAQSQSERLQRVFRFVADQIRYVGMEHGTSAIVPREARVTLQRRFGDCKDKVTLFLALARHAGLEAFPALVASQRFRVRKLFA